MYRDTVDVEKALPEQILAAIEKKYLQAIKKLITESITSPILKII